MSFCVFFPIERQRSTVVIAVLSFSGREPTRLVSQDTKSMPSRAMRWSRIEPVHRVDP